MRSLIPFAAGALFTLIPATALQAGSDPSSGNPPAGRALQLRVIANCVEGSPPLTMTARDLRTVLDGEDRFQFKQQALLRYPLLAGLGLEEAQIMLWARTASEWLYVSVVADTGGSGAPCFNATFTGDAFEFTPLLRRKYFPGVAAI